VIGSRQGPLSLQFIFSCFIKTTASQQGKEKKTSLLKKTDFAMSSFDQDLWYHMIWGIISLWVKRAGNKVDKSRYLVPRLTMGGAILCTLLRLHDMHYTVIRLCELQRQNTTTFRASSPIHSTTMKTFTPVYLKCKSKFSYSTPQQPPSVA